VEAVNMHEAKSRLSALVEAVESGREPEIILARNGKPAARIVPLAPRRPIRLGLAKDTFRVPTLEEWQELDREVAAMFDAEATAPDEPAQ
jgi:prevent-host-death family protein